MPASDLSVPDTRAATFGLLIVFLGTLVVPFDSAVNVAFPDIVRSLALPIPDIQWVVIAYTLTYAALMLVFGRIGDLVGHRRIFLAGTACSTIGFVACGAAPGFATLLAGRLLQGVGAAMALSCGPALATLLFPESQRTRILAWYTMIFGIGGVLGSACGGPLVAEWGWPAVFWARAPISLAAFLLAWWLPRPAASASAARFDAIGAALLVCAVAALLLGLNQLRADTIKAVGLGVVCLGAAIGFVRWERQCSAPVIDLDLFRDRDFTLVNLAHIALNLAGFSVMLLVPFYLDRFGGLGPTEMGLVLTASNLGLMAASPLAGRLAGRVTPRALAVAGAAAMGIGQVAIAWAGGRQDLLFMIAGMAVQGAGLGLFQVAYFDIVTGALPRHDRGVAGSLVMMTRTVGVVTGATLLMLLFQSLRTGSGLPAGDAFLAGFGGTFALAAVLPAAVVIVGLACGWGRRG
ncbi:MAG: MFS transporter [Rhodospirillales bacterium]|nr:MFS transporter [Rhodospirillales bacterium]